MVTQVLKSSPGTSGQAFVSTFWKVTMGPPTPYGGGAVIITKEIDFDKSTQAAYNYIMDNRTEDGKIVIYGYSHGGVLANHLVKRLQAAGVNVDLLVTVDAARGEESDKVDRTISDNVKKNINYYQTTESSIGSRGDINKAINPNKTSVENINMTSSGVSHGNIDEKSKNSVVSKVIEIVN